MNKIILFGPPGIGKSTTIKNLRKFGHSAIDLEDYPQDKWLDIIKTTNFTFYGAAGVNPTTVLEGCVKILLVCKNQKRYEQRRAIRDHQFPLKAAQRHHTQAEWKMLNCWDKIVNIQYGDYDTSETRCRKFIQSIREFL